MEPEFTHDALQTLADEIGGCAYLPYDESLAEYGPRGGRLEFLNGYSLSVAYGKANYCNGGLTTAETAVIEPSGEFVTLSGDYDSVQGWQTWDDVEGMAHEVASW